MASSALPETLKSITEIKIQELTNQRHNFELAKTSLFSAASSTLDPLAKTKILLEGVRKLKNVRLSAEDSHDEDDEEGNQSTGAEAYQLRNNNLILRQAQVDPSVPASVVTNIQQSLERNLELESLRHRHAQLFSELVTEWLSNPDEVSANSDGSSYEEVGRKEMHEQRATWESLVFSEAQVDTTKIDKYLTRLFTSSKASQLAYDNLVKSTKAFSSNLIERKDVFDPVTLKDTMAGLAQTDLLSEEKNATLRTFMANKEVLKEVSDVLNMRFAALRSWKWTVTGKGIPVEMRRQLNGKYRVFMDEDVLDAIILYDIGLKWAVHFKTVFTQFFNSFAWKTDEKTMPKIDRQRREYYLVNSGGTRVKSVKDIRRSTYSSNYFLTQLPVNESSGKRNYDDDNDNDDDEGVDSKSPLELKHGLLHMLVTESLIARHLRPDTVHTVLRSDFKWFGPALPHSTIFTVLKFFGVDETWLDFFCKFLQAPMFFVQDGLNASVGVRKRGLPMSHTLSDVFSETVLFVMDYAVNQATSSYLYRLHDDFWIWGSESVCLTGWQSMTKFADVMGIDFNEEKTGTVRFGVEGPGSSSDMDTSDDEEKSAYSPGTTSLPEGEVRWGFLRLDAMSRRFLVDQKQVDEHISELKTQLSYCKSVFSWIQSYNAYVGRFFTNNFGKPSYGFGREHVDMMISTFARIQKALFPGGSVTDYLTSRASERFNIDYLPQGFWYFPVEQGGLELRNPLIPLLGMRESLRRSPRRMLKLTDDEDEAEYLRAEQHFKEHNNGDGLGKYNAMVASEIAKSGETFLSKEEFLRYREEKSSYLAATYVELNTEPLEEEIQQTAELSALLTRGSPGLPAPGHSRSGGGILSSFLRMQPYWKWMIALYGTEIVEKYGSVRMVDGEQVPLGVVSLMKKGRVRWRG